MIKQKGNSAGRAQARYSLYLYLGDCYGTLTRRISLLVGKGAATERGNTY